jgi:hypothetical protein
MLHIFFFPMLFDWSTFFLCFLEHKCFLYDPSLLLQEEKSLWNLEYLFLVGGWHVLCNSWCKSSIYMWVYVISIMGA